MNGLASQFNPYDAPIIKCDKCGNDTFIPAVQFRLVKGVLIGSPEDVKLPIKTAVCAKCGEMIYFDREELRNGEQTIDGESTTPLIK